MVLFLLIPMIKRRVDALDEDHLKLIALLVGLVLLKKAMGVLIAFYKCFLRPGKKLRKYGEWAVITGATDGIGKAYAFEMAQKGMNIMLISRTESKLVEVKKELEAKYPKIKVDYLAIDYGKFDKAAQDKVSAALASKEVGILVNNVGMSYPHPKYTWEVSEEEWESLLTLNVDSTVQMTRIVLPQMVQRKKGCIVNLASGAAMNPTALLVGYAAAKGFVVHMSESMHYELAPKGVHVQCHVPLLVTTKLSKVKRPSMTIPTPKTYAKAAIKAIGYEPVVSPFWAHRLQLWLMSVLPFFVVDKILFNMHAGLRKKALKKQAEKKD